MYTRDNDEKGFVSIIVASILMVLVSLVVLGLATIMQREQRQALDRQLSTQAFYAAETGVNDLANVLDDPALPIEKDYCDLPSSAPFNTFNNGVIRSDEQDVKYTCLIYDKTPGDLVFTDTITTSASEVFPIQPESGNEVGNVTFTWNGPSNSTSVDDSGDCTGNLPASFANESIPMLRVDLIAAPAGASFDKTVVLANTASYYFIPAKGACSSTFTATNSENFTSASGANAGQLVYVNCDESNPCAVTVNIDTPTRYNRYYARVKSVYNSVGTLNVTATDGTGDFEFLNAQTLVDVTGKANDVLRRIEVRISNEPNFDRPEAVLETNNSGFCKTLGVVPGVGASVDGADCYN